LDTSSGGSFSHLTLSEGKDILGKILENTPYTGIFDEFPDEEEEEPMQTTLSEPKPIKEEHTFPTIQSVEDRTPLTKTTMNHSNHIERLTIPHVISSTSFTMSYLLTLGILGITEE
jgi:hypothetical protein